MSNVPAPTRATHGPGAIATVTDWQGRGLATRKDGPPADTRCGVLVDTVRRGFAAAAIALREIRDDDLWKPYAANFNAFCAAMFGYTPGRARQIVAAAAVLDEVAEGLPNLPLPINERQTRMLATLPPGERAGAWAAAVEAAGANHDGATNGSAPAKGTTEANGNGHKAANGEPRVTAAHVRRAVASTAAVAEPAITDEAGAAIPSRLSVAFAARTAYDDALGKLQAVAAAFTALERLAGGKGREWLRLDKARADLANLRTEIKFARPYAVCPHCNGKGCAANTGCRGAGYLPKDAYDRVPAELRKGA